ncbi:hypothetical protein GC1_00029 [Gluconobacter phage GC1]|uniref:Uncharacterized protein n=1 Tax=Gluconobacter phage GC1 TaxID=2047788 RepID=A0A2I5AR81_9VIRU|nr:hypothetical protein FDJ08_gp29 [Gluconobacter phage GC1]ATS92597.1 hypothetical protein GC1_00029 [Gluconobacter phage GC1]
MTPEEKGRIRDACTYLAMNVNAGIVPRSVINSTMQDMAATGRLQFREEEDESGFPIPRMFLYDTITGEIMTPEDIWRRWND